MAILAYLAGIVALTLGLDEVVSQGWMSPQSFRKELVEIGLQVLVFGAVAGVIKLVLDESKARSTYRAEVLRRLGLAHKDVYRIRRLLPHAEEGERLRLLGELMDARQELGGIYHEVRTALTIRSSDRIRDLIKNMRDYLEEVTDGGLDANGESRPVYEDFVRNLSGASGYQERFKKAYLQAKALADPSFRE